MAHWKERDHWLSNEALFAQNEIWDGERSKNFHGFGTLKQDGLYQLCAQTASKLWAVNPSRMN